MNKVLRLIESFLAVLLILSIFLFFILGGLWFVAFFVMLLWNFIAIETHHATSQISFWASVAVVLLLALVGVIFRFFSIKTKQ